MMAALVMRFNHEGRLLMNSKRLADGLLTDNKSMADRELFTDC
jgi:hypothetical protein